MHETAPQRILKLQTALVPSLRNRDLSLTSNEATNCGPRGKQNNRINILHLQASQFLLPVWWGRRSGDHLYIVYKSNKYR